MKKLKIPKFYEEEEVVLYGEKVKIKQLSCNR
jgi:hypothetical protein